MKISHSANGITNARHGGSIGGLASLPLEQLVPIQPRHGDALAGIGWILAADTTHPPQRPRFVPDFNYVG